MIFNKSKWTKINACLKTIGVCNPLMSPPIWILATMLVILCTGCATVGGYLRDRTLDAFDVFSVTLGLGGGVAGRAGPVHLGLGAYVDSYGIRGGDWRVFPGLMDAGGYGMTLEDTLQIWDSSGRCLPIGAISISRILGASENRYVYKCHQVTGGPLLAFLHEEEEDSYYDADQKERKPVLRPYYTQIDCSVAALFGVRIGFNPGELLDFCLGFLTIDLYKDDDSSFFESVLREKLETKYYKESERENEMAADEADKNAQEEARRAGITNEQEIAQKGTQAYMATWRKAREDAKEKARQEADRIARERGKKRQ
ncbi:MAG: hypothetical protein NTX50_02235 [Candidatus Sumerlaeota bacterium]|nr:hypothetical protein [Candidatus Sumerlaeota bacterium]